jgi:NAD(P)-dependent dehydrogenase (short-subunit alcohol dehydrogenase family)
MNDKAVVITGASTGIGQACARFLDERGFRVFAGVRTEADAGKLRNESSERLMPVLIDVTDLGKIDKAVEAIEQEVGEKGLDGLVNNAGISVAGALEFLPLQDLRRQFDVNLFGQVAVTQAFLGMIRRARGRVVNMSSVSGRLAAPFLGPYAMSKFALEAFSDSLRRELHPWGIQVSVVEPGAIATPIWDKAQKRAPKSDEIPEAVKRLYGKSIAAMRELAVKMSQDAAPAIEVAKAVHHALTAARPKTRYLVGPDAKMTGRMVRLLPDRALDWMTRKHMGFDG